MVVPVSWDSVSPCSTSGFPRNCRYCMLSRTEGLGVGHEHFIIDVAALEMFRYISVCVCV